MFYVGRLLQIIGLGLTGIACLIGFDSGTTEREMWTFDLGGLLLFLIGHVLIPKR